MADRQPLQPRTITYRDDPERDVRLALLANGYPHPFPVINKTQPAMKAFQKLKVTVAMIWGWDQRTGCSRGVRAANGTALLLTGDLFVIDLDIKNVVLRDRVLALLERLYPAFMEGCLMRHSGAVSVALIGRVSSPVGGRHTHRWTEPGDDTAHHVECFGSATTRYFVVHGVHSEGRSYGYEGDSIVDRPKDSLPVFQAADVGAMIDACDAILRDAGLEMVARTSCGPEVFKPDFDLVPGLMVRERSGELVEIELYAQRVKAGQWTGETFECYANLWDPTSRTANRCRAGMLGGKFAITDWKTGIIHRWRSEEKPDPTAILKAVRDQVEAERARLGVAAAPRQLPPDATANEQLEWLLGHWAFHNVNGTCVDLYGVDGASCEVKKQTFVDRFSNWFALSPTGNKPQPLTTSWMMSDQRIQVDGVRLEPGKPFPLFEEDGRLYKNLYQPIEHAGSGTAEPFWRFGAHLLPDPAEAALWRSVLAHKLQHPEIPGWGVLMVAVDDRGRPVFGCGRNTLYDIVRKLIGHRYCAAINFNELAGEGSQSTFTSHLAHALIVTVEEVLDSGEGSTARAKRRVYETLKTHIDPRPKPLRYNTKFGPNFEAINHATLLAGTNNADAVRLPPNDRRLLVLSNGEQMPEALRVEINAWMEVPGNIAALARELLAIDLAAFDPYADAPMTPAKRRMTELAQSEMDALVEELAEGRGPWFGREQIGLALETRYGAHNLPGSWREQLKALLHHHSYAATRDGKPVTVTINKHQYRLFAFTQKQADKARDATDAERQQSVQSWIEKSSASKPSLHVVVNNP